MDWIRVPTDLMLDRLPDSEIAANVRYQSLWAHKEREPSRAEALRHMKPKQLMRALEYRESIRKMVEPDIKSVKKKRGRDKQYYYKTRDFPEIPTDETVNASPDVTPIVPSVAPPPQRIEENNKLNKNKENDTKTRWKIVAYRSGYRGIRTPVLMPDAEA